MGDFWTAIAGAHRVDADEVGRQGLFPADPLESEPESDEEERIDGVFSPEFKEKSGVQHYMDACRALKVMETTLFCAAIHARALCVGCTSAAVHLNA